MSSNSKEEVSLWPFWALSLMCSRVGVICSLSEVVIINQYVAKEEATKYVPYISRYYVSQ